jgi:hypothetical protein
MLWPWHSPYACPLCLQGAFLPALRVTWACLHPMLPRNDTGDWDLPPLGSPEPTLTTGAPNS